MREGRAARTLGALGGVAHVRPNGPLYPMAPAPTRPAEAGRRSRPSRQPGGLSPTAPSCRLMALTPGRQCVAVGETPQPAVLSRMATSPGRRSARRRDGPGPPVVDALCVRPLLPRVMAASGGPARHLLSSVATVHRTVGWWTRCRRGGACDGPPGGFRPDRRPSRTHLCKGRALAYGFPARGRGGHGVLGRAVETPPHAARRSPARGRDGGSRLGGHRSARRTASLPCRRVRHEVRDAPVAPRPVCPAGRRRRRVP